MQLQHVSLHQYLCSLLLGNGDIAFGRIFSIKKSLDLDISTFYIASISWSAISAVQILQSEKQRIR